MPIDAPQSDEYYHKAREKYAREFEARCIEARHIAPELLTYLHQQYGPGPRHRVILRQLHSNFMHWARYTRALAPDGNLPVFESLLKHYTKGYDVCAVGWDYLVSWSSLKSLEKSK